MALNQKQRQHVGKPLSAPAEAAHDQVLSAAWAYFIEDKSQAEVAEMLNVSRSTVHNYLRQARADGLVRISLDPALLTRSELAAEICGRYGLEAAYIVPRGDSTVMDRVCSAAGLWLSDILKPDGIFGLGWGETIYKIGRHMPQRAFSEMTVAQLLGSLSNPFGYSADRCANLLAERLGARCSPLHAPAVCAKPETARALRLEPVIASQLASLSMCDTVMVAVGETHRESHIRRGGYMTAEEDAYYDRKSPAAAYAGRFINNEGAHIPGPIDERIIGISLADLRAIRQRVVVSVGAERRNGLRATLRGKFATHLVTDLDCALQLVELEP